MFPFSRDVFKKVCVQMAGIIYYIILDVLKYSYDVKPTSLKTLFSITEF